jgi:hypothetical protein
MLAAYVIGNSASFPTRQKKPDCTCFINVREMEVEIWMRNMRVVLVTPQRVMFML